MRPDGGEDGDHPVGERGGELPDQRLLGVGGDEHDPRGLEPVDLRGQRCACHARTKDHPARQRFVVEGYKLASRGVRQCLEFTVRHLQEYVQYLFRRLAIR